MDKKKVIFLSIIVSVIGMLITTGTFAFFTWQSNINKGLSFNIASNLKNYIEYDNGDSTFVGDFQVSNSFTDGIHSTISVKKKQEAASISMVATINMDINAIGTNMAKSSALKWVVTSGNSSSVGPILSQGNFIGSKSGDTLMLLPNIEVTTSVKEYTIWIWLDASEHPSDALSGETLDTAVWTQIEQLAGMEEIYEITKISANYQRISATVINNKNVITKYAITTTNNTPTSWTSIDTNLQNNIYNLEYNTSATGTYYAWFMDSTSKTVSASIQVTNIDNTPPSCTFGSFNPVQIANNETSQIILTCTDAESTIENHIITKDNLITSSSIINITNVRKEQVTNGYKYIITVTGTENDGSATLTLPANIIRNSMNLGNEITTSTASVTVRNIIDLSSASITLNPTSFTYDGTAKEPAITVTLDGDTLTRNTDYSASFTNNINVGTATVIITGINDYEGSASATFTITGASIDAGMSLTGTPTWGENLNITPTCNVPSSGCSYTYQWYESDTNSTTGGSAITGATSSTYAIEMNKVNKYIYVVVTITANNYETKEVATITPSKIAKRYLDITTTNYSGVYDGSIHYATIKVNSQYWNGATIVSGTSTTYGNNVTTTGTVNTFYNLLPGLTNATNGVTNIYYQVSGGSYYRDTTGSATINITKAECDAPTNVAITPTGLVNWTNAENATGYEISIDGTTYTEATNSMNYNSTITASTGTRTVYVRSICNSNYNSPSNSTSATTTVYNVTLTAGSGISSITGAGNYITGATVSINATLDTDYAWINWTSGSTVISNTQAYSAIITNNWNYTANAVEKVYSYTTTSGTAYTDTLSSAFANVTNNGTITTLKDNTSNVAITNSKNVTLSVNGKTITLSSTITNSTSNTLIINGDGGTITTSTSIYLMYNNGILTTSSITLLNTLSTTNNEYIMRTDGTYTANNGTQITNDNGRGILIYNGTVNLNNNVTIITPSYPVFVPNVALGETSININGATITSSSTGAVVISAISYGSSLNITSGSIIAGNNETLQNGIYLAGEGVKNVNITGGFIKASAVNGIYATSTCSGTITLGSNDSTINSVPIVIGTGYGIRIDGETTWNWYDGELYGNQSDGNYYNLPNNILTGYHIVTEADTTYAANGYKSYLYNKYTITANASGGSITSTSGWTGTGASATKDIIYGSAYGTLPSVSKSGYTFIGWSVSKLPSDYQEVEYIEANGTQWIDSGVIPTLNSKMEIKLNSQYIGESAIFGSDWSLNGSFLMFYNNAIRWHSATAVDVPASLNTDYVIETGNGYLKVNGTNYTNTQSTSISQNSLKLYYTQNTNNRPNGQFKTYYWKIYDGNTLVRDFVPCYRKSDGVAGLYDVVNGVFYTNSGSGSFSTGLPTTYQRVEYLDHSGSQYIDTGFIPNQDTTVEFKYMLVNDVEGWFYGVRNGSANDAFGYLHTSTHTLRVDYGNQRRDPSIPNGPEKIGYITTFKQDKNKYYLNNTYIDEYTYTNFTSPGNMYIFALNNNGTAAISENSIYLYYFKIWDNDTLVRDFVPCYRKSDGVAGLYDVVNGVFYTNSGSGIFNVGPNANVGNIITENTINNIESNHTIYAQWYENVYQLYNSGSTSVGYADSLTSAVATVPDGGTIKVLKNNTSGTITSNKNLTIDTNGKTITLTAPFVNVGNKNLTITGGGTITGSNITIIGNNAGTLTTSSVTIANNSPGNFTINNGTTSTYNVNTGTNITNSSGGGIALFGGTVNFNNGTINTFGNCISASSWSATITTVNVFGGSIVSSSSIGIEANANINNLIVTVSGGSIVGYNGINNVGKMTTNISGGYIYGRSQDGLSCYSTSTYCEMNITGGTIIGYRSGLFFNHGDSHIVGTNDSTVNSTPIIVGLTDYGIGGGYSFEWYDGVIYGNKSGGNYYTTPTVLPTGYSHVTVADNTYSGGYKTYLTNSYTVHFNSNGGSGSMPDEVFSFNTTKALTNNSFTKTNYGFTGWSTSSSDKNLVYDNGEYGYDNTSGSGMIAIRQYTIAAPFTTGEVYQVEVDAKGTGYLQNYFYGNSGYLQVASWTQTTLTTSASGTNTDGHNSLALSSTYTHYTIRFTLGSNGDGSIVKYLLFRVHSGSNATIKNVRFYKVSANSKAYADGQTVKDIASTPTVNLYAIWGTYTVQFNANGGSGSMANESFPYETAKALNTNTFTRTGYTFTGWSTSSSDKNVVYDNSEYSYNNTSATSGFIDIKQYAIAAPFVAGEVYQVEFDAKGSGNFTSYFYGVSGYLRIANWVQTTIDTSFSGTQSDGASNIALTSLYKHYTIRYTLGSSGNGNLEKYLLFRVFAGNSVTFKNVRFYKVSANSQAYADGQMVKNISSTSTINLYAIWTGNSYTTTFYYNSNTTVGSTTIASTSASCQITSGTSCTITIPATVRSSVGTYNNAYAGLSTSVGNMTANVASASTTITLSANTTYYAIYSTAIAIYRPTSLSTCGDLTLYRNQWFTNTTTLSSTILSANVSTTATTSFTIHGGTIAGFSASSGNVNPTYTTIAALANSNLTTVYGKGSATFTATFYYNNNNNAGSTTLASATSSGNKIYYCTSNTGAAAINPNITIPAAVRSSVGTWNNTYAGLSSSVGNMTQAIAAGTTTITISDNPSYYAIYRTAATYYYPTNTTSCTTLTLYRNQWFTSNTAMANTVMATAATGTTSYSIPMASGYNLARITASSNNSGATYTNSITSNATVFWLTENKTVTATFKYSNAANGTVASTTANGTQTIYCSTTASVAIDNGAISRTIPGTAPYGTTAVGWATGVNSIASVSPNTGTTTYYASYRGNVTIYKPSSESACSAITMYRNAFMNAAGATTYTAVLTTTNTSVGNTNPAAMSWYNFNKLTTSSTNTGTSYTLANAAVTSITTFWATYAGVVNATFKYSSNASGTVASTTASNSRLLYCTSTANATTYNNAITPSLNQTAPYGTTAVGWTCLAGRMTDTTTTPGTGCASWFAVYRANVTNYYYNNGYTNRTIYRNSFMAASANTAYTTVLSTSNTGTANYTTAVGPNNAPWAGLATTATSTVQYSTVASAAVTTATTLYTIYQYNRTYAIGTNVSSIGANSGYCRFTTGATTCNITLPSITTASSYTAIGWATTSGTSTGIIAGCTLPITSTGVTMYGNATITSNCVQSSGGSVNQSCASGCAAGCAALCYNQGTSSGACASCIGNCMSNCGVVAPTLVNTCAIESLGKCTSAGGTAP